LTRRAARRNITDRMAITVTPAREDEEQVLRNLVQLYAYDFAEILGFDIPDSGRFPDAIADDCFAGAGRHPFFIRVDEHLAGFAIVDARSRLTGDPTVRDVAEFFVARRHRGRGVGATAAHTLFTRFGGRWEVREKTENVGAIAFWRKVIDRYTAGRYADTLHAGPEWQGPVQSFTCP
jgi:predicted acetyltransferase